MAELGTIYFAAVDLPAASYNDVTHAVEDEIVLNLRISQTEGEFAVAEVEIENPGAGLLNPGRKKRCFISIENPSGSPKLIFAGRIIGYPTDLTKETVTLQYIAQPDGWETEQQTLMDTLKVAPFYDDLYISEDKRNDPAEILAGRTSLIYWDRVTNVVSISDIIEDGVTFDRTDKPFFDSIQFDIGDPPITQVNINIETQWVQTGVGTVDIGTAVTAEFDSPVGNELNTLTPYSFEDAWNGVQLPQGYTLQSSSLTPVANSFGLSQSQLRSSLCDVLGVDFPRSNGDTTGQRTLSVPRVYYVGSMILDAVYQQKRTETASIALTAVTQEFALKSNQIKDLFIRIQNPTEVAQGSILDPSKPSFFWDIGGATLTADGRAAIEHGLARGRAVVTKAARIVETTFSDDLRDIIDLTTNDNVRIDDARFPGGSILGKVIAYTFSVTEGGGYGAEVTIGSVVGTGIDSVGTGGGDETKILAQTYDNEFGAATMEGAIYYTPVTPTISEPIDVAQMIASTSYLITNTTVNNDGDTQDTDFAAESINAGPPGAGRPDTLLAANPTDVTVDLRSMNPSADLSATITITVEDFTLPKHTDLEA